MWASELRTANYNENGEGGEARQEAPKGERFAMPLGEKGNVGKGGKKNMGVLH